ncbi:MAG TPA: 50S ribosomal protein L11 methyltransferase [Vicinamibacterales bacterium]|nr:50S ribosomal protein L11 methyltransferase [Vicinamibacterales bacterium]
MRTYPALDVRTGAPDMLAALVDDFSPVALEPRAEDVRVFFATPADRDAAQHALTDEFVTAAVDVPDEDWARRSQENLPPVTVGRITVTACRTEAPEVPRQATANLQPRPPSPVVVVIQPSMGFGTGHHATTRLCLAALQTLDLNGRDMLDVGAGSGVLAIAAARLGAARAIGIDCDPDAIQSARENLTLNGEARNVSFEVLDLAAGRLPAADVVTANLTGPLLERSAPLLLDAVRPDGTLILSGILAGERDAVALAFRAARCVWEREEDEWVAFAVKKS